LWCFSAWSTWFGYGPPGVAVNTWAFTVDFGSLASRYPSLVSYVWMIDNPWTITSRYGHPLKQPTQSHNPDLNLNPKPRNKMFPEEVSAQFGGGWPDTVLCT